MYVTWDYSPNATQINLICANGGSCYYSSGDFNAVFSKSTDGGLTWTKPTPINPDYPNGGAISAPINAEPNGKLDVLYLEYNVEAKHVLAAGHEYFVQSSNQGNTWSPRKALLGCDGSYQTPTEWWIDGDIARDSGGVLYATFDTQSAPRDNAWITYSLNEGKTWSHAMLLGPVAKNGNTHIQAEVAGADFHFAYASWILIDSKGGWHVYAQTVKIGSSGIALSSPLLISNQTGVAGVWGGDTTGISSYDANKVSISWGYGVKVSGENTSEIFEVIIPRSDFG